MGTAQVAFAVDQDRKSRDRKWRKSRELRPVRKYFLRMSNWKLRNIRPSGVFWPEATPDRKYVLRMPGFFPRFFLSSSTVVTWLPDLQPKVVQHP
jgi:hypothetical protein